MGTSEQLRPGGLAPRKRSLGRRTGDESPRAVPTLGVTSIGMWFGPVIPVAWVLGSLVYSPTTPSPLLGDRRAASARPVTETIRMPVSRPSPTPRSPASAFSLNSFARGTSGRGYAREIPGYRDSGPVAGADDRTGRSHTPSRDSPSPKRPRGNTNTACLVTYVRAVDTTLLTTYSLSSRPVGIHLMVRSVMKLLTQAVLLSPSSTRLVYHW